MNNYNKSSNGRINIMEPDTSKLFALYDKIPAVQCATYRDPTEGIWNKSQLSEAFFSPSNMQILQNGIRSGVYKKSNSQYVVGNQDCDTLKIVMRSVFLQHSANQPNNINEQISSLNNLVLQYCIQQVYGEAQGYKKYLYDVSNLAVPMATPINTAQYDKKTHLMPKWF